MSLSEQARLLKTYLTIAEIASEPEHTHAHSHSNPSGLTHREPLGLEHSHSHDSPSNLHTHEHVGPQRAPVPQRQRSRYRPTEADMDKLRSTVKQFVRDWSVEVRVRGKEVIERLNAYAVVTHQGKEERESCYAPMKEALLEQFKDIPEEER